MPVTNSPTEPSVAADPLNSVVRYCKRGRSSVLTFDVESCWLLNLVASSRTLRQLALCPVSHDAHAVHRQALEAGATSPALAPMDAWCRYIRWIGEVGAAGRAVQIGPPI